MGPGVGMFRVCMWPRSDQNCVNISRFGFSLVVFAQQIMAPLVTGCSLSAHSFQPQILIVKFNYGINFSHPSLKCSVILKKAL